VQGDVRQSSRRSPGAGFWGIGWIQLLLKLRMNPFIIEFSLNPLHFDRCTLTISYAVERPGHVVVLSDNSKEKKENR
jgi:hypothetical protein